MPVSVGKSNGIMTLTEDIAPQCGIGQRIGPYELIREAGRGGAATVYEALDTRIGRRVAIKIIRLPSYLSAGQRDETVQRLMREARAAGRLSHPNIVTMHDVGSENDLYYLVMEFLDGETLHQRLQRGPLPMQEAARIADQLASALEAVHEADLLHRDIKPGNVMILPNGQIKLMDFGIARQMDETMLTQAGSFVGTPAYMSPEQCQGGEASGASDTWALAVLLYQMLAGHRPFDGPTIPAVMYQVTHEDPPPIPSVSEAVNMAVSRGLDKDPARRYGAPTALAEALRKAIDAAPEAATIESEPETIWARPTSPRRKFAVMPAAVIAAALVLGGFEFGAARRRHPNPPAPPAAVAVHIRTGANPNSTTNTVSAPPSQPAAAKLAARKARGKIMKKAWKHPRRVHHTSRRRQRLSRGHGFSQGDFFALAHQILGAYGRD